MEEHINKKELMAEVNALSSKGAVKVTNMESVGQDVCSQNGIYVHFSLPKLSSSDFVFFIPIAGETCRELYVNIIQAINDKLCELADAFKKLQLTPKLWSIPHHEVCAKCGGANLYNMEFRTDYAVPRLYSPINEGTPDIEQEDVPYRMGGAYCMDCGAFCETVTRLGKLPDAGEEADGEE